MQDPRKPGGGLLDPLQWFAVGKNGQLSNQPASVDPLAMAQQAQQMALGQMQSGMPAGSSWSTITRGSPMDFDALRMQLMMQQNGMQPGREDPTPGSKPPPGGGGGGGRPQEESRGLGLGRPADMDAQLSWQNWSPLPGVKDGDLGSVIGYMNRVQNFDPYENIPWKNFFRSPGNGKIT